MSYRRTLAITTRCLDTVEYVARNLRTVIEGEPRP